MSHAEPLGELNWVRNLARRSAGVLPEASIRPPYQPFFLPIVSASTLRQPKPTIAPPPLTTLAPTRPAGIPHDSPATTARPAPPAAVERDSPASPSAEGSRPLPPAVRVEPAIEAGPAPARPTPLPDPLGLAVRPDQLSENSSPLEPTVPAPPPLATAPPATALPAALPTLSPAGSLALPISEHMAVTDQGELQPTQVEGSSPMPAAESSVGAVKVERVPARPDQALTAAPAERSSPKGETLPLSPPVRVEPATPSLETQSPEPALPTTGIDSSPTVPPLVRPAPPVQPPDIAVVEPAGPPVVQVHIGTVEVRANRPSTASTLPPAPRPQGFERYLHLRGGEMEELP